MSLYHLCLVLALGLNLVVWDWTGVSEPEVSLVFQTDIHRNCRRDPDVDQSQDGQIGRDGRITNADRTVTIHQCPVDSLLCT